MFATGFPAFRALLAPLPVCTLYQISRPMNTARKIPPIASGRIGMSRGGRLRLGARFRLLWPGRCGALELVRSRGLARWLVLAEGTSFRIVRIPVSFLVPPAALVRPL